MSKEVIAGLLKRRAEPAGEGDALRARVASTVADMRRLDAVIRQFDPAYNPKAGSQSKRLRGAGAAGRGEMARFILGELRKATGPLTAADLARRLAEIRSAAGAPYPALGAMARRMAMALRLQELNGALAATRETGKPVLWMLAKRG